MIFKNWLPVDYLIALIIGLAMFCVSMVFISEAFFPGDHNDEQTREVLDGWVKTIFGLISFYFGARMQQRHVNNRTKENDDG